MADLVQEGLSTLHLSRGSNGDEDALVQGEGGKEKGRDEERPRILRIGSSDSDDDASSISSKSSSMSNNSVSSLSTDSILSSYAGGKKDGMYHGFGTMRYPDGRVYEGFFFSICTTAQSLLTDGNIVQKENG